MPQVHYFNPGHETAVLSGKENYTPPANVQKMMQELACLPIWYAKSEDFVYVENYTPDESYLQTIQPKTQILTLKEILENGNYLPPANAAPWGISPHSLSLFKKIKSESKWDLTIPEWKEEYFQLTGRQCAAKCLKEIQDALPQIKFPSIPSFYEDIHEIEKYIKTNKPSFIIKTPYSSSGRGLLWITNSKLSEKEKNWISGAIKKQGKVSIEEGLIKIQDFAMEFYSNGQGSVHFEGLSYFETGVKGAYSGNLLQDQSEIEDLLTQKVNKNDLIQIKEVITDVLQNLYGSLYCGYLGVDMMIYQTQSGSYQIHPCVEINMRYTMGMVALRIFQKHIHNSAKGHFFISYENKSQEAYNQHLLMKKENPIHLVDGKIRSGYLALCPVHETTHYKAYLLIK